MRTTVIPLSFRSRLAFLALARVLLSASIFAQGAPSKTAELSDSDLSAKTDSPRSIDELRQIEKRVQAVYAKVAPATVAVFGAAGQGSGVIVSKDGYVLTAGHVIVQPGSDALLVLSDGRRVAAKALGIDRAVDMGMLKISDPGDWPFVERGGSANLKLGQFLIALGHPTSEYRRGRQPALRIGRLALSNEQALQTDCVMDHGDSGGPLFDLMGRLVGINDAIGDAENVNVHTPIDAVTANWDRLVKGESFGVRALRGGMLGLGVDDDETGCRITGVVESSPADKAGFKAGDLLLKFGAADVKNTRGFAEHLVLFQGGEEIRLTVQRDGKPLRISVRLAATTRPSRPAGREQTRDSTTFRGAFRTVVAGAGRSVVRVRSQGKDTAMGTIVSADGFILTPATSFVEPITCAIQGKTLSAKIIGRSSDYDLAMLKVDATNLAAIAWDDKVQIEPGEWVVSPGPQGTTLATGMVSVARESTRAELQIGYAALQPHAPGGFPAVFQTDAMLHPRDCGGPVVNLDGKAVGLNIARASRAASSVIPAEVLVTLIEQLKTGNPTSTTRPAEAK